MSSVPDNWYEKFFAGINCEIWERAASDEWTKQEVDFLIKSLQVVPGDSLLDVPCGFGRHALALAKQGYSITAIDISDEFIKKLKARILKDDLPIEVIHADILTVDLSEAAKFDGAYCLGNSFGFFDYSGMQIFTTKIAEALRPGSKFIINSGMVAESVIPNFAKTRSFTLGDLTMDVSNHYDAGESCMTSSLRYIWDDKVEVHRFKHYVYTLGEITRLLKDAGLKVLEVFSSADRTAYQFGDEQMYLVAEKK
jgi:cyclopropane fatty-acyl-phospholipid synthase-like methyltransferase